MSQEESVQVFDLVVKDGQLPATLDGLVPLSFIGAAAVKFYQAKVQLMDQLGMTEDQRKATLHDGQDAGKMLLDIEARIGELLPTPEEALKTASPGGVREKRPVTQRQAHAARTIHRNPEAVAAVIREAEENEDIPTKTAVLNKIKAQKAEERADRYKAATQEAQEDWDHERAAAPYEVQQYITKMEQALVALPTEPPHDGWTDKTMERAVGYANVFVKKLGRFLDEDLVKIAESNIKRIDIEEAAG